jgi:hypothetical protein
MSNMIYRLVTTNNFSSDIHFGCLHYTIIHDMWWLLGTLGILNSVVDWGVMWVWGLRSALDEFEVCLMGSCRWIWGGWMGLFGCYVLGIYQCLKDKIWLIERKIRLTPDQVTLTPIFTLIIRFLGMVETKLTQKTWKVPEIQVIR